MTRLGMTCVVGLLAALVHLPLLGTAPLAGTEAHRAVAAYQMVQREDPWIPMLYGRVYLRKPPLHYQILAGATWITGRADPWVWRLPSVFWAGLTAAVVAWFAAGWWGPSAGWTAGLMQAGMVALWAQSRSCEIDALNTLLATLASLAAAATVLPCSKHPGRAALALALSLAGLLACKGPAGLPPVLGVTAAALLLLPGSWRRGGLWLGWLGGFSLAGIGALMIYLELQRRGLPLDLSGLREGVDNLYDTRLGRFVQALLLPPQLIAFSLPASALLLVACCTPARWARLDAVTRLWTLAIGLSWAACVLSGMVNPRYAYVTFPLVALAAGGAAASGLIPSPRRPGRPAAVVAVAAMLALSLPFAWLNVENKRRRSGLAAATELRARLDERGLHDVRVLVAQSLRYQPELMFYAGLNAFSPGEQLPPLDSLPPGTHLLVTDEELAKFPPALTAAPLITVTSNGRKLHWVVTPATPRAP